jgi:hypothetical protein
MSAKAAYSSRAIEGFAGRKTATHNRIGAAKVFFNNATGLCQNDFKKVPGAKPRTQNHGT